MDEITNKNRLSIVFGWPQLFMGVSDYLQLVALVA
uniref:Uncharacterized protein n=1 Tax=Rhizophora mucronata TaxID=61149 RepID=A0A2P2PA14_RHIMU